MKYESPNSDVEAKVLATSSCSNNGLIASSGPGFIPKGLSKYAYSIITKMTKYNGYNLIIKDMTKEEVFNLSREISDFNLGVISFPITNNKEHGITIYPIEDIEYYMIETRLLKYSAQYEVSELCTDICNMSEDGYKLSHFRYIPNSDCYAALFSKYND